MIHGFSGVALLGILTLHLLQFLRLGVRFAGRRHACCSWRFLIHRGRWVARARLCPACSLLYSLLLLPQFDGLDVLITLIPAI